MPFLRNKYINQTRGRSFVVGDLHGCYDQLQEELIKIHFDEGRDVLYSVGDLVDRGKKSYTCAVLINKPWFHSVMGNHEQMAIQYYNRKQSGTMDEDLQDWYIANGGKWFVDLEEESQEYVVRLFNTLPLTMTVSTASKTEYGIVHGDFLQPSWFDGYMKASENELLWGRTRIRAPSIEIPQVDGVKLIYCGHTPVHGGPKQKQNVRFIDTGAVFGDTLTIEEML